MKPCRLLFLSLTLFFQLCLTAPAAAPEQWVVYDGYDEPGYGRHIVLISGDEEYRSEEALPQLGKILAQRQGFKCTVLFAQDPANPGIINPNYRENIPGLEALETADLMIIATRFRALPDDQMRMIDDYLISGRPVVGLRTANHGFRFPEDSAWAHYGFNYDGEKTFWSGGFGWPVLGSVFFSHHGWHGRESTGGIIAPGAESHVITNGIEDDDVWGATDVYGVKLPLPGDCEPIVLGAVLSGMESNDVALGPGPYEKAPAYVTEGSNNKNDPMMPVAWTKNYQLPGGVKGRVFSTSLGASIDLTSEGTRRMIVNGVLWCLGLTVPEGGADVALAGEFEPAMFGTKKGDYWEKKGMRVDEFAMKIIWENPYAEAKPEFPYMDVTGGREGYRFANRTRNLFRLYDFYARQAEYYLSRPETPEIVPEFPGIDGGAFGHWGRFSKNSFRDRSWNLMRLDTVFSGILRVPGIKGAPALPRAVAVHLGEQGQLATAFDTETLRYAHLWRNGFVSFADNRYGIGGGIEADGEVLLSAPPMTGWSASGSFPKEFDKGAVVYHGHYRQGKRAAFSYNVEGLEVLDSPGANGSVLTRTLEFRGDAPQQHLLLFPAAHSKAEVRAAGSLRALSLSDGKGDKATVFAVDADAFGGEVEFSQAKTRPAALRLTNVSKGDVLHVFAWTGDFKQREAVLERIAAIKTPKNLRWMTKGGPAKWDWTFTAAGELGEGKGPYVIDRIPVPARNPYGALMLIGGHDFFSNGDAAVCTMMGDVWRVSGLDESLEKVTWKRIATGLNQALGVWIENDELYVLGRDRINRLHDLNGDGEIDFYENFSDAFQTEDGGHSFYTGLQRDGTGNWYFSAAGRIVRVSPDGSSSEDIASGARNTNGVAANSGGIVISGTNEGDWTPANMVIEVRQGDFYGRGATRDQTIAPPLCYLPRGIDNSVGGQVFATSDRWGPLQGQLLSFSYGTGTWQLILRDGPGGEKAGKRRAQGAVVPLPGDFASGAHRGRFSPRDGQLYVTGADGWGNYAVADGSFDRVRYTGAAVRLPVGWKAHANGIAVRFAEAVAKAVVKPGDVLCQQWNYEYSAGYGSAEYSVRKPAEVGHDVVPVRSVQVLDDGRSLFFEIPDLRPAMQSQLHARLRDAEGMPFILDMYPTILSLDEPFTEFAGYKAVETKKPLTLALRVRYPSPKRESPEKGEEVEKGREITIQTAPGLQFATKEFRVKSGERISLLFDNTDALPHNLVIVKPGAYERVGEVANAMITDPAAFERHYVPDFPAVLFHTSMIEPHRDETIHFTAPAEPGEYPYMCTFPGHWLLMKGKMIVE